MTLPLPTLYPHQLPSESDPVTFSERAALAKEFEVNTFLPELVAIIEALNDALVGADNFVSALADRAVKSQNLADLTDKLQALTNLGISGIGSAIAGTITNANTHTIGGRYFAAAGVTGGASALVAEPTLFDMIPADSTARAVQFQIGLTTGAVYRRIETASAWGAWALVMPAGGFGATGAALAQAATEEAARSALNASFLGAAIPMSNAAVDFTGIPAHANEVTFSLFGITRTGAQNPLLQAIVGGSAVTSGYVGATSFIYGSTPQTPAFTNGFGLPANLTGDSFSGEITLKRHGNGSNQWVASGNVYAASGAQMMMHVAGRIALAGPLTGLRFTANGGTFSAGTGAITWRV